jgi:hypothetical protein
MNVHIEVVLMAGYAVFLLACATGLSLLARRTSQPSDRYRTVGLAYHPDCDREVLPRGDSWPHAEAQRFHQGIALVLVALAGFVLAVEAFRHHQPAELVLLGMAAALTGTVGWRLAGHFRRTPANFPEPRTFPAHSLGLAASDEGWRTP